MKPLRLSFCLFALVAAFAFAVPAGAEDTTPGENLGGYDAQASAMAFSFQPVFPALLPTGDAPVEGTIGLATGRVKSGGNAAGRGAIIWPGNAAADPGPLIGAGFGQEAIGALIPKWPLQAQAVQGEGEVTTGAPPAISMKAYGFADRGAGDVRAADVDVPGLLHAEHVASTSETTVTDGAVSSVARVAFDGVSLFDGHVTVEQIRSLSKTTSNGGTATTAGDVDIVGMKIGGIDVSVTDDGFKVTGAPPDAGSAPGAGGEPFPGQSPEEQVQEVLANLGARITLFHGVGRKTGGQAQHYELGLVFSIDNPVVQGPIPPGRFDVIVGSTASSTFASMPFRFDGGGFGESGATPSREPGSVSIGEGPAPGAGSLSPIGEQVDASGDVGGGVVTDVAQRSDYKFGGVPASTLVILLLAALLAARYMRNFFLSVIGVKSANEGSEA
ncbi:MAG TPA: choice-of-anchor P family protein [Actinomycetota bacterium]|jgi:hypothetical protein|nr:choice-of-anchor P family protein [Actinomycetota bacterium]